MKTVQNLHLPLGATIRQAMKTIDDGALGIAFVIDQNSQFIGTLSDGDIRRGLLNDMSLDEAIDSIVNEQSISFTQGADNQQALQKANENKILHVPVVDENGLLIGLESLTPVQQITPKSNKVVLMVGGMGTRLRPLTDNIPKPMLKVGDKPILETIIENFKKHGYHQFILSVSYKAEVIVAHFGDGAEFGIEIEYVYEDKRMGTAGALGFMKDQLTEPFFVMNGDLLTNVNFEHMLDAHQQSSSLATMGVREYDYQVPYGVVKVDDGQISAIEEKPIQQFYVNGGIYVLDHKMLDLVPRDAYLDMPTLFEKAINAQMKTIPYPIHEYWLDIGRHEEYEKANNEYAMVFKGQ